MEQYIIDFLDKNKIGLQYENLSEINISHIYNLYKNDTFDDSEEYDDVFYYYAGHYYKHKDKYRRAIELFQFAVDKGNDNAMHTLAVMYRNGTGVQKDYKRAIELYQMAIEKGNAKSMNNLALMYDNGKGVERDYRRGRELYELAISKGSIVSIHNLAIIYKDGTGVPKDYKRAVQLYEMAINKGYVSSMRNLACMYVSGKEVQKDYKRAIQLYEMALKNRDEDSITALVELSNKGDEYYKIIRKVLYEHYKRTNNIGPLRSMKDGEVYIIKKKNKELENRIKELETKVEMLMCAPPPAQGGPIYQSSCEHFTVAKKERDNLYIDNNLYQSISIYNSLFHSLFSCSCPIGFMKIGTPLKIM